MHIHKGIYEKERKLDPSLNQLCQTRRTTFSTLDAHSTFRITLNSVFPVWDTSSTLNSAKNRKAFGTFWVRNTLLSLISTTIHLREIQLGIKETVRGKQNFQRQKPEDSLGGAWEVSELTSTQRLLGENTQRRFSLPKSKSMASTRVFFEGWKAKMRSGSSSLEGFGSS